MSEEEIYKMAKKITDDIFSLGGSKCCRIQFMVGNYPREDSSGGLCKDSFCNAVARAINSHSNQE